MIRVVQELRVLDENCVDVTHILRLSKNSESWLLWDAEHNMLSHELLRAITVIGLRTLGKLLLTRLFLVRYTLVSACLGRVGKLLTLRERHLLVLVLLRNSPPDSLRLILVLLKSWLHLKSFL